MTYNWNNMVSITVPTGTNGWLYSGEVIINGVKVRFPVGVPTSVPEPAAVLLQKMIELEQEEDANTAKPQNHYVGDVTIPAGKTLTLEEGAMVNDMAGGLGGGSASAGGGVFRVVCENGEPTDDIGEGAVMGLIYTPDKTGTEILSAFNSGKYIFIDFINPMGDGSTVRLPVITAKDDAISGGAIVNGVSMIVVVTWDDAATTIFLEVYPPTGG